MTSFYKLYWRCSKKYRLSCLAFVFFYMFFSYPVKTVLSPYILGYLVDNTTTLSVASGLLLLFLFSFSRINFLIYSIAKRYERAALDYTTEEVREYLFDWLLKQPVNYFEKNHSGSILQKIDSITSNIREISTLTMFTVRNIFTLIIMAIILCHHDLYSGLLFIGVLGISQLINLQLQKTYSQKAKSVNDARNDLTATINDGLQNILNIKLFQGKGSETAIITNKADNLRRNMKIAHIWEACGRALSAIIILVIFSIYAFYLLSSCLRGEISRGELIFYLELMRESHALLHSLFYCVLELSSSLKIFNSNITDITNRSAPILNNTGKRLSVEQGKIIFKGVSFSYDR